MPFDHQDCRQTISNWIDEFNNYINSPFDHQNEEKNCFWWTVFGVTPLV